MNSSSFKRARLPVALLLASVCAPTVAHAQNTKPQNAKLVLAVMAKSVIDVKNGPYKPVGVTTVFKPTDRVIHCVYQLDKPVSAYGRTVWTAIDVETIAPNTVVHEARTKTLPNLQSINFSIKNGIDWPRGQFKVALYVNTRLMKTLYFSVK